MEIAFLGAANRDGSRMWFDALQSHDIVAVIIYRWWNMCVPESRHVPPAAIPSNLQHIDSIGTGMPPWASSGWSMALKFYQVTINGRYDFDYCTSVYAWRPQYPYRIAKSRVTTATPITTPTFMGILGAIPSARPRAYYEPFTVTGDMTVDVPAVQIAANAFFGVLGRTENITGQITFPSPMYGIMLELIPVGPQLCQQFILI